MNNVPYLIYKYRNWSDAYHKRILTHNELFLAPPISFNDPFDCEIHADYSKIENKDDFICQKLIQNFDRFSKEGRDIQLEIRRMSDEINDTETFQKKYEQIERESLNRHTGVISFSTIWDNILMWSHYANNHMGICIGFREDVLKNSELFGMGGLVSYRPDFPSIIPELEITHESVMKNTFIKLFTKSIDWEYEKEYRLARTDYPKVLSKDSRIIKIADNAIKEVILGLNIEEEHIIQVSNICAEKGITLYKMEKVPGKFKLKRVLIPLLC